MLDSLIFIVSGEPIPKQSFRYTSNGGGYTDPRVSAWQAHVTLRAREAMQGRDPVCGPVAVRFTFVLSNNRRVDLDNLSKGTMDSLRGVVFGDDSQVVNLHLVKQVRREPGVLIEIYPGDQLPFTGDTHGN